MSVSLRYDRQSRLAEVGPGGQARIEAASADSCGDPLELSYLERAGFRAVALGRGAPDVPFAHEAHFHFEAPARVGASAWRALSRIRQVLGVSAR